MSKELPNTFLCSLEAVEHNEKKTNKFQFFEFFLPFKNSRYTKIIYAMYFFSQKTHLSVASCAFFTSLPSALFQSVHLIRCFKKLFSHFASFHSHMIFVFSKGALNKNRTYTSYILTHRYALKNSQKNTVLFFTLIFDLKEAQEKSCNAKSKVLCLMLKFIRHVVHPNNIWNPTQTHKINSIPKIQSVISCNLVET